MGAANNWVWFFRTVPPLTHTWWRPFFPDWINERVLLYICVYGSCSAAFCRLLPYHSFWWWLRSTWVTRERCPFFLLLFFLLSRSFCHCFFFFLLLHMTRLRHTEKGSSSKQFRGNVNVADSGPFDWHGHFPFDCQSNPFPCGHNQIAAPCPFFVAYLCAWHVWSRRVTWPSAG